jgi:iron complex outermembrane receptor protein
MIPQQQSLGIPQLKQEESKAPVLVHKIPEETYFDCRCLYCRIDDRVTLTDQFSRPSGRLLQEHHRNFNYNFDLAGANAATFCQCYYYRV